MGDDAPIAVLSERPHIPYNYFKQRFAQVTNPPIDPLREGVVMSVAMTLGKKESIYKVSEKGARLIHLESPVLNSNEMAEIATMADEDKGGFKQSTLSTRYSLSDGPEGIKSAIDAICDKAVEDVRGGVEVLILSDKAEAMDEMKDSTYIPPLVAVGAVHHRLIDEGLRMDTGIVVETGSAWSTHHFACLVGYGANAVHPYLALETVKQWYNQGKIQKMMEAGKLTQMTLDEAQANYRKSIENGLLKILSKMGISLLTSYQGAQIFEAMGLGEDVIGTSFKGTTSRIGGMSLSDIASETVMMRPEEEQKKLVNYGYYKPIPKMGEYHANSADLARLLHNAIGLDKKVSAATNRDELPNDGVKPASVADYEIFKKSLESAPLANIRDLLDFESDRESISIDEVESTSEIMKRFCTGAMSLGALSREAHETLAIAVNRVGGKSNSGEGGEDVVRGSDLTDVDENGRSPTFPHLAGLKNGDSANSYIHQVASGRFGVTPEFLVTAKQLEIKMAQGAKPGEGGQLPGPKVSDYIATLRASKQGVTLISPPPHHDIYSIEVCLSQFPRVACRFLCQSSQMRVQKLFLISPLTVPSVASPRCRTWPSSFTTSTPLTRMLAFLSSWYLPLESVLSRAVLPRPRLTSSRFRVETAEPGHHRCHPLSMPACLGRWVFLRPTPLFSLTDCATASSSALTVESAPDVTSPSPL